MQVVSDMKELNAFTSLQKCNLIHKDSSFKIAATFFTTRATWRWIKSKSCKIYNISYMCKGDAAEQKALF